MERRGTRGGAIGAIAMLIALLAWAGSSEAQATTARTQSLTRSTVASEQLTGAAARALIEQSQPGARVQNCHRVTPRNIRCRALVYGDVVREIIDAQTGVLESEEVVGEIGYPFGADVGLKGVCWFLPGLSEERCGGSP